MASEKAVGSGPKIPFYSFPIEALQLPQNLPLPRYSPMGWYVKIRDCGSQRLNYTLMSPPFLVHTMTLQGRTGLIMTRSFLAKPEFVARPFFSRCPGGPSDSTKGVAAHPGWGKVEASLCQASHPPIQAPNLGTALSVIILCKVQPHGLQMNVWGLDAEYPGSGEEPFPGSR